LLISPPDNAANRSLFLIAERRARVIARQHVPAAVQLSQQIVSVVDIIRYARRRSFLNPAAKRIVLERHRAAAIRQLNGGQPQNYLRISRANCGESKPATATLSLDDLQAKVQLIALPLQGGATG
jgi:hypothetical protein